MIFKKLWKRINPFSNIVHASSLNSIHSEKDFRIILERERSRADRDGSGFTLIIFDMEEGETCEITYRRLLKALTFRSLRSTDEIGWFSEKSVGVLLYNTTQEGARIFANNFRAEITALLPTHSLTVYSHATDRQKIYQENSNSHERYPHKDLP